MKNIDLLARACAPAPETIKTPAAPVLNDDMIQRVAERVVQILSNPAAADPEPEPEPALDPAPEPETLGGELDDGHTEPSPVD